MNGETKKEQLSEKNNQGRMMSRKIGYSLFAFLGMVCAFLWITERELAFHGNIVWTSAYLWKILVYSFLVGGFFGSVLCFFLYKRGKRLYERQHAITNMKIEQKVETWKTFLCSLLLIVLAWLPAYLAYYPAICAYDTTRQLEEIGSGQYVEHHPIAHTLLLQGSMEFGENILGNVNGGVGVFTLAQMILLASVLAYGILMLAYWGVKKEWRYFALAGCMFYSFHWYLSVSVTKDILFSVFFVLVMISLCDILGMQCRKISWSLFVIGMLGMIIFRSNGKYALLILEFFFLTCLIWGRKDRKLWIKLFVCNFLSMVVGSLFLAFLFSYTEAEQGDKREMLSMPIQQMARCMIYHGGVGVIPEDDDSMDVQDRALVNDFILHEGYKNYRPDISDPVKSHTNTYVVRYRTAEFVRTYFNMLFHYPGDFVNAALAVNAGYLSPGDRTHAYINLNGRDMGLGYVQTRWVDGQINPYGIYKDSKWNSLHQSMERWADDNAYLELPLVRYIFVPGTFLWCYLFLAATLLVYRKYRMLLPLSLVAAYYGTLFLGPTVQLRYLYPLMIMLPFLFLYYFMGRKAQPTALQHEIQNVKEK